MNEICSLGTIRGTVKGKVDMAVYKHGRTTGLTRGVISDPDDDLRVSYGDEGAALFLSTFLIRGVAPTTPFSAGGDSGSLILANKNRACALLFAGSTTTDSTFAIPIGVVLRKLRIKLV